MGIVRMGVPEDIVIYLKNLYGINIFIETGTFHGWTSYWASSKFKQVKTIEFSEEIYLTTKNRFRDIPNIEFIFGDSRKELQKIVGCLFEPAIFWLDAHWCSFGSYGENDQCPLLEEIDILNLSKHQNIILIDDARLFLAPPPLPNSVKYYPSISELINKLQKKDFYIIIYEDILICVPMNYKDEFADFMQKKTTIDSVVKSKKLIKKEQIKKFNRTFKKVIFYKYWSK